MSQISAVLNDSSCQVVSSTVPDTAGLRFSQPVPRGLVHRSSVAEVFITDGARREGSGVAVAAQWPRDHALYHPDHGGLSDPLLFAETLRQAHFYTAHTYFEVPLDHHFIGRQLQFEITDPAALRVGDAPLKVVLEGEWTWVADHPTLVSRRADARLDVQLVVNGTACGRGMARGLLVNDRRYRLLRRAPAGRPAGPTPELNTTEVALPHRVGRLRRKDCVLERDRGGKGWQLRMDRDHAVLFDHPTDHVPLMVMLEGFRQIGHLVTHEILESPGADREFVLAGMALDCFAFGELHETVDLVVEECEPVRASGDGCRLRIAALQNGTPLARADTTWVATRRYGGRTGALAG